MQAINYNISKAFKGSLRPLALSDLNELWQLDLRCFVDGEAYERETFRYLLSNSNTIARQIRSEFDEMSAFAIAVIEPDGVGHITTIGVAPEYRRRGLARLMLHEIERSFLARRVSTIRLEVRVGNTAAQKLYEQLNYIIVQRMGKYYSNGDDGYLMVKSLETQGLSISGG
ncbi:MAG TPA: GNAT family N-acetyltransferase [Blastocatellia bacterium]|nr:GNAT family N-acetyltransferase [Blastocatellia bacterium]